MPSRWPPLNLIRGFEAAGRLQSFSKAAEELDMTQSAISHQIRTLETFLGQPLFKRIHRRVVLTDAGHDLLLTVQDSLYILGEGLKRLDQFKKPNQIVVSTSNGFASKWLVPRLPKFRAAHPHSDVWLYTTDRELDFETDEVDVAILLGDGRWSDVEVTELMEESLFPVCSPALLPAGPVSDPGKLLDLPLLHDERWEDWSLWFTRAGLGDVDVVAGANFSDHGILLQATIDGQGVALGSNVLAADDLAKDRLMCPFELTISTINRYHIVVTRRASIRPRIKEFITWLSLEAASVEPTFVPEGSGARP